MLSLPGVLVDPQGGSSAMDRDMEVQVVDFQESTLEVARGWRSIHRQVLGGVSRCTSSAFRSSGRVNWLETQTADARVSSYTPEVTAESGEDREQGEVPMLPRRSKAKAKPAAQPGADGGLPTERPGKQKKPTTAGLATAVETLSSTLEALLMRQQAMEERLKDPPNPTTTALRRPLSAQVAHQEVALSSLAREFQSPKVQSASSMIPLPPARTEAPPELVELEREKPLQGGTSLADAMLAQSAALTTLVAQLSSGQSDPMGELTGGFGMGVKGAQGRARLQAELASNKGLFYDSVMKSMARRMSPTLPSNLPHDQMMQLGICGTKYLERFGGYGKFRDWGVVQHQIMTMMDYFQTNNIEGAKDTAALLAVMIEQTVLDNGRMELGQVLCLADDVPASIFSNRSFNPLARSKAFSPLAEQRWVTTALAYLRELDTITTKRLELTGGAASSSSGGGGQPPAPKVKPNPKKKWKPKPQDRGLEGEEEG